MKMTKFNYALIGDVHSQSGPLAKALDYCLSQGLTPVLLGDLFDSRCHVSDSAGVYKLVRHAQRIFPGMIILRSNHQDKLERYIKGNRVTVYPDLQATLDDFQSAGIRLREDVLPWLQSFPFGFVFRDSKGTEYRCAHACFSSKIEIPEYDQSLKINDVTRKEKDWMLYGPRYKKEDGSNERIQWWNRRSERKWIRVAGHYHSVIIDPLNLVLDGEMGGSGDREIDTSEMSLCLYNVESKSLHKFLI